MVRFEDHVGVAHILARQGFARAQAMGSSLRYEDIFQEVGLVFSRIVDKFDESKGFKFTTYLTTCVLHHFNNTLFKKEARHVIELGIVSVEDLMTTEEGDVADFYDRYDSGVDNSPEAQALFEASVAEARSRFSPCARQMLTMLSDPDQEVLDELARIHWHKHHVLGRGEEDAAPTLAELGSLMVAVGVDKSQVAKAKTELLRYAKTL